MNAVGNDLSVGVRGENVAQRLQFVPQLLVILDDAVVDDRETVVGNVGVGVLLAGNSVGGPAGMGDTDGRGHRLRIQGQL